MDINKYLEDIQSIDSKVDNKRYEADMWREIAQGTASKVEGDRVQSSASQQKMANAMAKCVDIEREIEELLREKQKFIERIEQLPKCYYNIMHKIYIQGYSVKQVRLFYRKSPSWATTNHDRAKRQLKKLIERENHG